MSLIIRILFFCILSSLVHGQSQSYPTEADETASESMTSDPTEADESMSESMTSDPTDADESMSESMTSDPTEATEMTFQPQTTVDSVSTSVMNNCPPCPTCNTPTTCPSCSTVPDSTSNCPPCSTIASETTISYTPCEEPKTTTCLPCETTAVQTTCPPCTTIAPSPETMTPKKICDYLNGHYSENHCRYICKNPMPYKIIFDNYMVNGEPCTLGGRKGTCQPHIGCKIPPIPPSWW